MVVIGNKSDLDDPEVTKEHIATFCLAHPDIPYISCSAKSGEGVTEAFTALTEKCIKKFGKMGAEA